MENEDDQKIFLEQYKAYLGNVNEIGTQHSQSRAFYVSVISALLVFLSLTGPEAALAKINTSGQVAVAGLGIILCIAWFIHTRSYGKLFGVKFFILREMEKKLPFRIFEKELEKLKESNYRGIMKIESSVALLVAVLFVIILCASFVK